MCVCAVREAEAFRTRVSAHWHWGRGAAWLCLFSYVYVKPHGSATSELARIPISSFTRNTRRRRDPKGDAGSPATVKERLSVSGSI